MVKKYELIEVKTTAKNLRHKACEIILDEKRMYNETLTMSIDDFVHNLQQRIMNIQFKDVDALAEKVL